MMKEKTLQSLNSKLPCRCHLIDVLFSLPVDVTVVILSILACLLVTAEVTLHMMQLEVRLSILEGEIKQNCNYTNITLPDRELPSQHAQHITELVSPEEKLYTKEQQRLLPSDYYKYERLVVKKFGTCPNIPDYGEFNEQECVPKFEIGKTKGRGKALNTSRCQSITGVPKILREYSLSMFYRKYTHAYGIPILSSPRVSDRALQRACYVVRFMLADRPDIRDAIYDHYGRVGVIGINEETTTIPEHSWLNPWWNWRARGLGGTLGTPISTAGEENLLCLSQDRDRYFSEDIFVHELAHMIHIVGANTVIPDFTDRLKKALANSRRTALWNKTYANTNHKEYWAEAVQDYFSVNAQAVPTDGIHNFVNTRFELMMFDPDLYNLVREVFPCGNHIRDRCEERHLWSIFLPARKVLFYIVVFVIAVFLIEILLKMAALRSMFTQMKMEVFDAFLVIVLFLLELTLSVGFRETKNTVATFLPIILILRLWRISRLIRRMPGPDHQHDISRDTADSSLDGRSSSLEREGSVNKGKK